jgi:hypothetical protein
MVPQIDYEDTQLSDAELAEHLERLRLQECAEAEEERRRWAKARNFHFKGGLL